MKNLFLIFLVVTVSVSCSTKHQTVDELRDKITDQLQALEGDFAVAFINLSDTTQTIFINGHEKFHAASTMKTPVMIELFKQAEAGIFTLSDSIVIENKFYSIVDSSVYKMDISGDSEGHLYDLIGQKRTIRQLMKVMITSSSNLATNILIQKVGAENVTQTMRSFGADSILVLRGVEDIKAYRQGLSNRTAAYDEAMIYKRIAQGKAVNQQASAAMIEILKQQKHNKMIPAGLPEEVEVAHKTGWITGVNHDAGIVLLPDGRRYVLVLLSKNAPNREQVHTAFANISREIYEFVN
jgi:beta-lactamase class A